VIAYGYGAVSAIVQGLYLTLAQKSLEDLSALNVLYISSYNTVVFFIVLSLFLEAQDIMHKGFSGTVCTKILFHTYKIKLFYLQLTLALQAHYTY